MSTSDEIIALRQGYQARRAERQAQEREQELKELREDPRYIAAVRQGERERAAREAEVETRRRAEGEQRESEARVRLEREKERKDVCGSHRATLLRASSGTGPRSRSRSSWRITVLAVATSPSSEPSLRDREDQRRAQGGARALVTRSAIPKNR